MKKILLHTFILTGILFLGVSCIREELFEAAPAHVSSDKVSLDGSLCLPFAQDQGDWIGTKGAQMGEETPTVKYLYLAVFNAGDILYEIVKAKPGTQSHPTAEDAGFNCGTAANGYLTPFHVDNLTLVSAGNRYVHFIATTRAIPEFETMEMNLMDEATFVRTLTTTDGGLAYWSRRSYTSITETTDMRNIQMVRNFAKVKVSVDPAVRNFQLLDFKVMDTPVYGTVTPFNTSTEDYINDNGSLQINFDRFADFQEAVGEENPYSWLTESKLYTGFMPPVIAYDGWTEYYDADGDTMDANGIWVDAAGADYLYECSYRPDRNPFIIIRGRYAPVGETVSESSPVYYYKADFVYEKAGKGKVYYNILRNFCYTLNIRGVGGKGSDTVFDAVHGIALNNFEGSTMAQALTNIATDDSRLYVSRTDILVTSGTTVTMYVKSRSGADFQTDDNDNVSAEVWEPASGEAIVRSVGDIVIDGHDVGGTGQYKDWRRVTIRVADAAALQPGEVWKQPVVFRNGAGLTRTVNLTLRRPMTLTVDAQDVVTGTKNSECRVDFSIPAGMTEYRFPMYFYIEQEKNTLYPKPLAENAYETLTVETGRSRIPDNGSQNAYYYRRVLSWDEYRAAEADINGIKTFSSYFKTLVNESATRVWVIPAEENAYFYSYDDVENVWTNSDAFLNERIVGQVRFPYYGLQLAVGGSGTVAATTNSDGQLTYASSDPDVAAVDAEGRVTAVATGSAEITASVPETGSYTAASRSYTVTVTDGMPCGLELNWASEPTFVLVGTATLREPLAVPTTAAGYGGAVNVSYTASPAGIVTLNPNAGYVAVTGRAPGRVTITATATAQSDGAYAGLTRSISYELDVVSGHPASGTVYHDESFLGPTLGDYTFEETVRDYAGTVVTDAFRQYTLFEGRGRGVWYPYYNDQTQMGYGAAASGYGATEAPTVRYNPETTMEIHDTHSRNYASETTLTSKVIDLSASAGVSLTFYHAGNYFYGDAADEANAQANMQADATVYISADGGASWTQATVRHYPSGISWSYIRTSVEIPDAFLTAQFRLQFRYRSHAGNQVQKTDASGYPLYYQTDIVGGQTRILTTETTGNTGYPVMTVDPEHPGRAGTWEIRNVLIREE